MLITAKVIDDFWPKGQQGFYRDLVLNIIPILATTSMISAAWELIGKRSFAKDILALSKTSESIQKSGIVEVYKDFRNIDWEKEFRYASSLIMFLSYARTFRNNNREKLSKFTGKKFVVIIPDPDDESIIDELDRRFSYGRYSGGALGSVKEEINSAIADFISMGAEVMLYSGTILSTYYLMDDICIYAPFKHAKERTYVPALKVQSGGSFYEFCRQDIDKILERSRKHP